MPVSKQLNCIFVHIPKTGGTSIETALDMFDDWKIEQPQKLFGLIASTELQKHGFLSAFLQHLTFSEIQTISTDWQDFFSFSFVRNPWDKMVSMYSNPDPHMVKQARQQGIELTKISFAEFINNTGKIQHIHLLEQHKFIFDNNKQLVDFIGRFENLEADFQQLTKLIGISCQLPHRNKSQRKSYQDYYDSDTQAIVAERYQQDISMFGYSF
jgi:hypothetical protein